MRLNDRRSREDGGVSGVDQAARVLRRRSSQSSFCGQIYSIMTAAAAAAASLVVMIDSNEGRGREGGREEQRGMQGHLADSSVAT